MTEEKSLQQAKPSPQLIKSFCIDINWSLFIHPAAPGLYCQSDPVAQARWVHELGANVMQTFCASYNGYAWFPSDVVPVTPGLRGNFLQDQVEEGHRLGMKVMGYFCIGSNSLWAQNHEFGTWHDLRPLEPLEGKSLPGDMKIKDWVWNWIPFTHDYLDYVCAGIRDSLLKTDVDGLFLDWFEVKRGPVWLHNEKELWRELMGERFPSSLPSAEAELEFKRRQVELAWTRIRQTVRETRPGAILWTNHPFTKANDPLWTGHRLLKEVDWLLNEAPATEFLDWLEENIGPETKLIQNFCGWPDHTASGWRGLDTERFGFYGFAGVNPGTCLPWTVQDLELLRRPMMAPQFLDRHLTDARNIEILRDAYHSV